ncbi:hypothetical protein CEXT_528011 [Caerostris extrusa]|uniref:Uncharacterized protein n=1 Tax=Caerostris extrusa TaxID=172846 RepID=A0AAV4XBZ7_CAEEX|nr:hypothetical protein CEXT_528011 [Caerostris extrusa]
MPYNDFMMEDRWQRKIIDRLEAQQSQNEVSRWSIEFVNGFKQQIQHRESSAKDSHEAMMTSRHLNNVANIYCEQNLHEDDLYTRRLGNWRVPPFTSQEGTFKMGTS